MGFFDFLKKHIPFQAETVQEKEEIETDNTDNSEEESAISHVGTAMTLGNSTNSSIRLTREKFTRPQYNPETRKSHYDDGAMHYQVKKKAFADGKTVRDPYSKDELFLRKQDAKAAHGKDWQNHLAEADHIDPLNKVVERSQNKAFLTTENVKETANRESNYQVISRKNNQGNSEVGKGGSSQEEWANNDKKMENIAKQAGTNKKTIKTKIKQRGEAAEKETDTLLRNKNLTNAAKNFHSAGMNGAINAGVTAATISTINNVVAVINGEKDAEEALVDITKTGGSAAAIGYLSQGGMNTLTQQLTTSSSPFIQALTKSNVPGQIITAVMVTGTTLTKWGKGEISTQECLLELGEKGLTVATSGYTAAIGQTLIPIPIVGAAVGYFVGSVLTSGLYHSFIGDLEKRQLEHEERMRLIAEYEQMAQQARAYRAELEQNLNAYFKEYKSCFDDAFSTMQLAIQAEDIDGCIAGANPITRKLGGEVKFNTVKEFKSFLDSDEDDVL